MIDFKDIQKYLPSYLSEEAASNLFENMKYFPNNIDQRLYTTHLKEEEYPFQGDGFRNLETVNLPNKEINPASGMILSNTCDINSENTRFAEPRLVFATIIQLEKYKEMLISNFVLKGKRTRESILSHIELIKKQYISHMFFLPSFGELKTEAIVLLDRANNLPSKAINAEFIRCNRIFTLSDYGFYLFLYKLSIHFTRIRENVARDG